MFELNFADLLDPNHELMRAAKLIDWDELHEALRFYYSTPGRRGKPIRLMVGLQLLKTKRVAVDTTAWNMRKVTRLQAMKKAKAAKRKTKCAA